MSDSSAPRDTAPAQRWQHGVEAEVIDGRQQVARPVAALRKSGRIGDAEVEAAARFYRDYALGMCGARDAERAGGGGGQAGFAAAVIDAMGAYQDVRRALGRRDFDYAVGLVVEERSLRALAGGRGGRMAMRVAGLAGDALRALADHYAKVDGAPPAKASKIRAIVVSDTDTISLDRGNTM